MYHQSSSPAVYLWVLWSHHDDKCIIDLGEFTCSDCRVMNTAWHHCFVFLGKLHTLLPYVHSVT